MQNFESKPLAQVRAKKSPWWRCALPTWVLLGLFGLAVPVAAAPSKADFGPERASGDAQAVANWILATRNNQDLPFLIVDKQQAKVFVFHADGRLRGATMALVGLARGDDAVPDMGLRKLAAVLEQDRITPSGRFLAAPGRNLSGQEVLWIDYDAGISLHRAVAGSARERRAHRLASPTPKDNRITYGCINVPAAFFEQVVLPAVQSQGSAVYVLPETRPAAQVFGY